MSVKREIQKIWAVIFCLAVVLTVVHASGAVKEDQRLCPWCASELVYCSQDYDTIWVGTGENRICTHGHAGFIDLSVSREMFQAYRCSGCGMELNYDMDMKQSGWKCMYDYACAP